MAIYHQGAGSGSSSSAGITALEENEITGIGTDCSNEKMSGLDTSVWTFVSDSYPILTNNPEYLVVIFEAPASEFTTFTEQLNEDGTVSEPEADTAASYMKTGYTVEWYASGSRTAFDFDTTITAITTLTAGWDEILATGITLDVTVVEELVVDKTVTLQATVLPTTALNQSVTWSTSNSEIATVVDGVVTGVTSGEVIITATNNQGHTDTCTVTVVGKTPTTSVKVENWTYGATANSPTTITDSDGLITYKYSSDGKTFTSTVPSDSGTYYVKAYTSETSTYKSSESASYTFVIEPKEVAVTWVDQEANYQYTGSTLTAPTASYTDIKGTPISLTVEEQDDKTFCDAGTYVFEATVTDSNYVLKSGTNTKELSIAQKALTSDMLSITGTYTYTGSEIKPTITVEDETFLTSLDYEETYSENINASEDTAKVIITATDDGNYYGEISDTFEIKKANQVITVNAVDGKAYGEAPFTLSISGQKDTSGTVTYSVEDNDVITLVGDTVTIIGVGMVEITAEVAGDNNYNGATTTYELTIAVGYDVTIYDIVYTDVAYGSLLEEPTLGKLNGYYVAGWETAEGVKWDFDTDVVTQSILLQPIWAEEMEYVGEVKEILQNTDEEVVLTASGDLYKFLNLYLDGEVISTEYYTATQGSTIITFHQAFLDSLDSGEYDIKVDYTDGYAWFKLSVQEQAEASTDSEASTNSEASSDSEVSTDSEVNTGDATNVFYLIILMGASLIGVIYCSKRKCI